MLINNVDVLRYLFQNHTFLFYTNLLILMDLINDEKNQKIIHANMKFEK